MSWGDVLTEEEYGRLRLNHEIMRYLEFAAKALGRKPGEVKVLDWGCGRGNYVCYLRDLGYDAYGVDIDANVVERGRSFIASRGYDFERIISVMAPNGTTRYPSGFFEFVFSYQVLEHVKDLEKVVTELARITAPRGTALHIYPARWHITEAHLSMPFVHWLPKNMVRKWLIAAYVFTGIEPKWKSLDGFSRVERVNAYYRFSGEATHYRSYSNVVSMFSAHGFLGRSVVLDHPAVKKLPVPGIFRPVLEKLILHFKSVELLVERGGDGVRAY